jgi:hypothetical protein
MERIVTFAAIQRIRARATAKLVSAAAAGDRIPAAAPADHLGIIGAGDRFVPFAAIDDSRPLLHIRDIYPACGQGVILGLGSGRVLIGGFALGRPGSGVIGGAFMRHRIQRRAHQIGGDARLGVNRLAFVPEGFDRLILLGTEPDECGCADGRNPQKTRQKQHRTSSRTTNLECHTGLPGGKRRLRMWLMLSGGGRREPVESNR